MRNTIVFLLLGLVLINCNDISEHRENITKLLNGWEVTTEKLVSVEKMLKDETVHSQSIYDGMYMNETTKAKLSKEALSKADSLKQIYQKLGSLYDTLDQEVRNFIQSWREQSKVVHALKAGLTQGKISSQLLGKMDGLFQAIEQGNGEIEKWQKQIQQNKDKCFEIYYEYGALDTGNGVK